MAAWYSPAFIEQALLKVYSRDGRTIRSVSEELNVGYDTLKYWIKKRSVAKDSSATANHLVSRQKTALPKMVLGHLPDSLGKG
jgi:transposase